MYIQQPTEFPTNFLHDPNVTKAKGLGKVNTDIIALGNPCYDGMKTYAFTLADDGLHEFSPHAFTSKLLLHIEGDLSCAAVAATI